MGNHLYITRADPRPDALARRRRRDAVDALHSDPYFRGCLPSTGHAAAARRCRVAVTDVVEVSS